MQRLSSSSGSRRLSAVVLAGLALGADACAAQFSGNAALTTDYVWRGSSQTRGDPAVQAGLKFAHDSGFYASVWGSNVEFAPEVEAGSEFDFTVGWGRSLSDDWAVDVNLLHYRYPGTAVDLDWTEVNGTVTYRGNCWLSAGYSNQALGYDHDGVYLLAGAKFPIDERWRLEAVIAHYALSERVVAADGYSHGQLSAIWAFMAPLELRVSAHVTDSDAERIFGEDFAGTRLEAALQASF